MTALRFQIAQDKFAGWRTKQVGSGKWGEQPDGGIIHVASGSRAAWADGYLYMVTKDDVTAGNFARALAGPLGTSPGEVGIPLPEGVAFLGGSVSAPSRGEVVRAQDAKDRATAAEATTPATEARRAAESEGDFSHSVPKPRGEAEPGDVVRGEAEPGDVEPVEPSPAERAAAEAVQAASPTAAVAIEEAFTPVIERAEAATRAAEAEEAEDVSARAQEQAVAQEVRDALRREGIDVNPNANITRGYAIGVSIVANVQMWKTISHGPFHSKKRSRLPQGKMGWVDGQRAKMKDIINAVGATEIMPGVRVVPVEKVPLVVKKLNEGFEAFKAGLKVEVADQRDQLNRQMAEEIRKEEQREPEPDDMIPEDVMGMFTMKKVLMEISVPTVADLEKVKVERDEARKAVGDVLAVTRDAMERSLLKRFAEAYDKMAKAMEAVDDGKPLHGTTVRAIKNALAQIETADVARAPLVRAEMEKYKAYLAFVVKMSETDDDSARTAELAKTVKRVVAVSNAASPMSGGKRVPVPAVKSLKDGITALTENVERDMEANARRFGVSVEPEAGDDKENIKKVKRDGSVKSAAKALKAMGGQYARMAGK